VQAAAAALCPATARNRKIEHKQQLLPSTEKLYAEKLYYHYHALAGTNAKTTQLIVTKFTMSASTPLLASTFLPPLHQLCYITWSRHNHPNPTSQHSHSSPCIDHLLYRRPRITSFSALPVSTAHCSAGCAAGLTTACSLAGSGVGRLNSVSNTAG
jgi:hypothetical protein